jgi:putative transposase
LAGTSEHLPGIPSPKGTGGLASVPQPRELGLPALHHENYGVYGRRKMHALLRRQGWTVGRDQTERLMRVAGFRGRRSKRLSTTKADPRQALPHDLVKRRFTAEGPRRLWVADVTYAATWSGFAHVAFVTDVYSRRIVAWNVDSTLKADILPLRALDMAA